VAGSHCSTAGSSGGIGGFFGLAYNSSFKWLLYFGGRVLYLLFFSPELGCCAEQTFADNAASKSTVAGTARPSTIDQVRGTLCFATAAHPRSTGGPRELLLGSRRAFACRRPVNGIPLGALRNAPIPQVCVGKVGLALLVVGAVRSYSSLSLRQWGCGPIQTRTRSAGLLFGLTFWPRSSASWWESSVCASPCGQQVVRAAPDGPVTPLAGQPARQSLGAAQLRR